MFTRYHPASAAGCPCGAHGLQQGRGR